jgi:hypothetical protein
MRYVFSGILILFFAYYSASSGYCEDALPTPSGSGYYGGISLGTPGGANANVFLNPNAGSDGSIGFAFSVSLVTVIENGQDESASSKSDDLYTAMQIGIPFYLINSENFFLALSPLAGFGYYNPEDKKKGYWLYAGGAVDIYAFGFFIEAGLGYGPRNGIIGYNVFRKTSLLCSIGYLGRFGG